MKAESKSVKRQPYVQIRIASYRITCRSSDFNFFMCSVVYGVRECSHSNEPKIQLVDCHFPVKSILLAPRKLLGTVLKEKLFDNYHWMVLVFALASFNRIVFNSCVRFVLFRFFSLFFFSLLVY